RRHTRFSRDWSSDVCSSDLIDGFRLIGGGLGCFDGARNLTGFMRECAPCIFSLRIFSFLFRYLTLISTANITMQLGAKPLFENVSVKFADGNRYGLIGANGCGKSTFMKILGGDMAPTSGNVAIEPGKRL